MRNDYAINPELAKKIVIDIRTAAGADANVIGAGGIIIASFDPLRVGTVHEGGQRIMSGETDEVAITTEMALTMKGVKAGYNGAITVNGHRVGAVGIRGDPEQTKPLVRMAELAIREEILREMEFVKERQLVRSMEAQIVDIAERMKVLSLNGSIQAAKLGDKGRAFKIVVGEMRKLAEQINDIIVGISRRTKLAADASESKTDSP